jgi:hypothetical protein
LPIHCGQRTFGKEGDVREGIRKRLNYFYSPVLRRNYPYSPEPVIISNYEEAKRAYDTQKVDAELEWNEAQIVLWSDGY